MKLAVFERNGDRKCKMHRRRAALLEPLVAILNASAFDQIWKDLTYELGQLYQEIIEIKTVMVLTRAGGATLPICSHPTPLCETISQSGAGGFCRLSSV